MIRNLWPIWIMFLYVLFCNIIKVNHFCIALLYCFILSLLYCFIIATFNLFFFTYKSFALYGTTAAFYKIPLSSFELEATLISSVKTLCLSILNLCCVFNISLFFLFLFFFSKLSFFSRWVISLLLLNSFYNLES